MCQQREVPMETSSFSLPTTPAWRTATHHSLESPYCPSLLLGKAFSNCPLNRLSVHVTLQPLNIRDCIDQNSLFTSFSSTGFRAQRIPEPYHVSPTSQVKHSTHSNGYQGQRRSQKLWVIKPWRQKDGWKISTKPDSSGNPRSRRKDLTCTSCSLTSTYAQRHECSPTWKHNISKNKYINFQRFLKCGCVWVFCLHYVYVPRTCMVPTEATREYWVHWDWSLR